MATASSSSTHAPDEIDYICSDGQPIAETPTHRQNLTDLIQMIETHFGADPNIYVSGNMFVHYVEGNRNKHLAPDVFFVRGVDRYRRRDSYKTWEDGKGPDVVIELTSPSTRDEDLGKKMRIYRDDMGVAEYFLFDPLSEYLDPPMQGFRLVEGRYVPIPPEADRLPSQVLGLHLERDGEWLRLFDPATGRWVPTEKEARERVEGERDEARAELRRAEAGRKRSEKARRSTEAENERLGRELEELKRRMPEPS